VRLDGIYLNRIDRVIMVETMDNTITAYTEPFEFRFANEAQGLGSVSCA
jgi:hypothetical protein